MSVSSLWNLGLDLDMLIWHPVLLVLNIEYQRLGMNWYRLGLGFSLGAANLEQLDNRLEFSFDWTILWKV
ncbi:uncharacterized protein OCT59_010645 [Rhizophagus irregularis]|uniref:uncharacterized protein n=1 Tax=Rhizophagus irregularis TaxID=588596 RepID=UPI00332702AB|nr:hypothetical protein OCT59_010645 [Rhizophagus irregularis]